MSSDSPALPRTLTPLGRIGRKPAHLAAMALLLFASAACGDDNDSPTAPEPAVDVQASESVVTIIRSIDPTIEVSATVTGTTDGGVTWSSFNPNIATIEQDGTITAVADGQTFVTATSTADPTQQISVVVKVISTVVSLDPVSDTSWIGGPARTFTATVENNENTAVTWASLNAAVATVSPEGVVTPVAAGTATIVATSVADATKQATASFMVENTLTSGTPLANVAIAEGSQGFYVINVPEGATSLAITALGPNGDADIYVRAGLRSTFDDFDDASFNAGSDESVTIDDPTPGPYYIMIDAWEGFTGLTLTATVTGG